MIAVWAMKWKVAAAWNVPATIGHALEPEWSGLPTPPQLYDTLAPLLSTTVHGSMTG